MSFTLAPDAPPAPQTGKLEGAQVVARAGRDKPGFLRFGPYVGLKAGAYLATFSLAAEGVGPDEPVAIIQVVGARRDRFASKVLTGRQLPPLRSLNNVELPFATPGGHLSRHASTTAVEARCERARSASSRSPRPSP